MVVISNSGQASTSDFVDGLFINYFQGADAAADTNSALHVIGTTTADNASDTFNGIQVTLTNQSTAGSQRGIRVVNLDDAANAVGEAGLLIDNQETTADTLTDYILISKATTGADTTADAIDVSDADLFNAINVGGNFALFDGVRAFSPSSGTLTFEDTANNDLLSLVDAGTITMGSGAVGTTDIQLVTDSTGNGELVVPGDSIGTAEIDDNGITLDAGEDEYCLTYENDGPYFEWQTCGGSGSSYWTYNETDGTLYPINATVDLFAGGIASDSAKFSVLNMDSGVPTASLSGTSTNDAFYITGDGTLAATNMQDMNIGTASTRDILIDPTGWVGIGGAATVGKFEVRGDDEYVARFLNTTGSVAEVSIVNDGDSGYWGISNDVSYFGPVSGSSATNVNVDINGDVGLGTISPASQLHTYINNTDVLDAANGPQLILEQDSTGDAGIQFELTAGQIFSLGIDNSTTNDDFVLFDGATAQLTVDGSTGDVYITEGLILGDDTTDITTPASSNESLTITADGTGDLVVSGDADTNAQFTFTIASDATVNPVDITITDNAAASTGTIYGLAVTNADNAANVGVPDGLVRLDNANAAETVPAGLIVEQTGAGTLTDAIQIIETAGTITTAIDIGNNIGTGLSIGTGLTTDIDITDASGVIKMASGATLTIGDTGADLFTVDLTNNYIRFGDGTNNFTWDLDSNVGLDYNGTARPTKRITLTAEYPGAVLTGDGSNNSGTMTTDSDAGTPPRNYYNWTVNGGTVNDYDIWVQVPIPSDFDEFTSSDALTVAGWSDVLGSTTMEVIQVYDNAGTGRCTSAVSFEPGSPSTWTDKTTDQTCTDTGVASANDIWTIRLRLGSSNADNARVGRLYIQYYAKF
jgi:hypothetical protein